jgi:hypothetical protein
MILTASMLDVFDRCPRRFAFERTHEPRTISALGLLYAAVEGSLTALDTAQGARDSIMDVASRLEVNAGDLSPISAVRHVESMAEVIALALRSKLGRGVRPAPVSIGEHEWQSNLFEFRSELHRIILISHIDDDTLRSFAHSWGTIGELAAMERPITLTLVIVGSQRGGRRHSPWAKGFIHPVQKTLRIGRRKAGRADGFTDGWKEIWREHSEIKAETWLDRMKTDEQLGELIASRKIQYRAEDARMIQARKEFLILAGEMQYVRPDAPMRRSSCDEVGRPACGFQSLCYSPTPITPDDLPHLYRLREMHLAMQE